MLLVTLANQLRFPNAHTRWASQLFLHIYGTSSAQVKEIVLRILLERICSLRPHPFGLVMTLVELLRRFNLRDEPLLQRSELLPILPLLDRIASASNLGEPSR